MNPALIVGCGPGSPDLITPQARRAALQAEVLAGSERLLDLFPEYRGVMVPYSNDLEDFLRRLEPHLGQRPVSILVTGDPGIASLATTLTRRFPHIPLKRIAGLSSIQLAFAACGLDWMEARIIKAHGNIPAWDPTWEVHPGPLAILAGHPETRELAVRLATTAQRARIHVCERLSFPDERIRMMDLESFRQDCFDPLSIIILESGAVR